MIPLVRDFGEPTVYGGKCAAGGLGSKVEIAVWRLSRSPGLYGGGVSVRGVKRVSGCKECGSSNGR